MISGPGGAAGITSGHRILDVGAGRGNASLPAAATGASVTALDLTPELLEAGRSSRPPGAALVLTRRIPDGHLDCVEGEVEHGLELVAHADNQLRGA